MNIVWYFLVAWPQYFRNPEMRSFFLLYSKCDGSAILSKINERNLSSSFIFFTCTFSCLKILSFRSGFCLRYYSGKNDSLVSHVMASEIFYCAICKLFGPALYTIFSSFVYLVPIFGLPICRNCIKCK